MDPVIGVTPGVCTLWEQEELLDYTIEVGTERFKVHKVIMASVSDYFKAMLTGGMKECQTDKVRLEGLDSCAVYNMIEFIYMRQFGTKTATTEDLLGCAVYLQFPAAIKKCIEMLCSEINDENCFEKSCILKTYSLKEGIDQVQSYIKSNRSNILKVCKPNELSYDAFLMLMEFWGKSEWELFDSANMWISVDFDNRLEHLNDLMSHIRFGLMTPKELAAVKESFTFTKFNGSWCDLVQKAVEYHNLPSEQKVQHKSDQTTPREDLTPIPSWKNSSYWSYNWNKDIWKRRLTLKMGNIGLMKGVKTLWQDGLLCDYTIKVQGQKLDAHKVVLASVSPYFKDMVMQGFTDQVELNDLSADVVSKLLEFIYTEDEAILGTNVVEVLKCAMKLQMPSVAEKLLKSINNQNCLQIYSALVGSTFKEGSEKAKEFIKKNWKTVFAVCEFEDLSEDAFQVLIDYWEKSEWDMFLFINEWYTRDPKNQKDYVKKLLKNVRFCLIEPEHIKAITEMEVYKDTKGPWHDLLKQALTYHELPIHLKVLEKSKQSTIRAEPSAVFFNTGSTVDSSTIFALRATFDTSARFTFHEKTYNWHEYEKAAMNTPTFNDDSLPIGVEVNNYFIICTHGGVNQEWYIFDPRTFTWSQIASMPTPKKNFVLVHHADSVYVVGGILSTQESHLFWGVSKKKDDIEQYSLKTNTWNTGKKKKLPYIAEHHAVCVDKDTLYVCGGHILGAEKATTRFHCLDLASEKAGAVKRAPSPHPFMNHVMDVGRIQGKKAIIVVNPHLFIFYYCPAKDQWSQLRYASNNDLLKMGVSIFGFMALRGNSLYAIDVRMCDELHQDESDYEDEERHWRNFNLLYAIPERGSDVRQIPAQKFPINQNADDAYMEIFGTVLAFPH